MCIETRLRDAQSHLNAIIHRCSEFVTDDITWAHIVDAKLEITNALYEHESAVRDAAVAALIETQERANA